MKNSLDTTGLSMSQAQSVSNLCYQTAMEIENKLSNLNNVSKTLKHGSEDLVETQGNPIPADVVALLNTKADLHATQAFLMENTKAKAALIEGLKRESFVSKEEAPERPKMLKPELLASVGADWGKGQLSEDEVNQWLFNEAHAAHIGQFIHDGAPLDKLRKELPTLKTLEWITVKEGEKTPLKVNIHHTSEQLLKVHTELAELHRGYEQKVNYFKAKVNNLITLENARIAKVNANEQDRVNKLNSQAMEVFTTAYSEYMGRERKESELFESTRNEKINEVSKLRIKVSPLFKETIDSFLKALGEEQDK